MESQEVLCRLSNQEQDTRAGLPLPGEDATVGKAASRQERFDFLLLDGPA